MVDKESVMKRVFKPLFVLLIVIIALFVITEISGMSQIFLRWALNITILIWIINNLKILYLDVKENKKLKLWEFFLLILVVVGGLIIFFGFVYKVNADYGHGAITYNGEEKVVDIWESMYLSAVTFFSLGYGDYAPKGISMLFATLEVALAQLFVLIFIAVSITYRKDLLGFDNQKLNKPRNDISKKVPKMNKKGAIQIGAGALIIIGFVIFFAINAGLIRNPFEDYPAIIESNVDILELSYLERTNVNLVVHNPKSQQIMTYLIVEYDGDLLGSNTIKDSRDEYLTIGMRLLAEEKREFDISFNQAKRNIEEETEIKFILCEDKSCKNKPFDEKIIRLKLR